MGKEAENGASQDVYTQSDSPWSGNATASISAEIASLVVRGLLAAGFDVSLDQVSNQYIDQVAQVCGPKDMVRQEAVRIYLALLISVIEHPARWSIEPADLPPQITQYGRSWYQMALDSTQRSNRSSESQEARDHDLLSLAGGAQVKGHIVDVNERLRESPNGTDLLIDSETATEIAQTLQRLGYRVNEDLIQNRTIFEVAQDCEPQDMVKRNAVLALIRNAVRLYRGQVSD